VINNRRENLETYSGYSSAFSKCGTLGP